MMAELFRVVNSSNLSTYMLDGKSDEQCHLSMDGKSDGTFSMFEYFIKKKLHMFVLFCNEDDATGNMMDTLFFTCLCDLHQLVTKTSGYRVPRNLFLFGMEQ